MSTETDDREMRRVFIDKLSSDVSKEDIEEFFEQYGELEEVTRHVDRSDESRVFAFVVFKTPQACMKATTQPQIRIKECDAVCWLAAIGAPYSGYEFFSSQGFLKGKRGGSAGKEREESSGTKDREKKHHRHRDHGSKDRHHHKKHRKSSGRHHKHSRDAPHQHHPHQHQHQHYSTGSVSIPSRAYSHSPLVERHYQTHYQAALHPQSYSQHELSVPYEYSYSGSSHSHHAGPPMYYMPTQPALIQPTSFSASSHRQMMVCQPSDGRMAATMIPQSSQIQLPVLRSTQEFPAIVESPPICGLDPVPRPDEDIPDLPASIVNDDLLVGDMGLDEEINQMFANLNTV